MIQMIAGIGMMMYGLYNFKRAKDVDTDVDFSYPAPSPIEQMITDELLTYMKSIDESTPERKQLKSDMYASVGSLEPFMTPDQINGFSQEFTRIKVDLGEMAIREAGRAMGDSIDNKVASGQMSAEAGQRLKLEQEASIEAVLKVQNRKVDQDRIKLARQAYIQGQKNTMGTVALLSETDNMLQKNWATTLNTLQDNLLTRRTGALSAYTQVANAEQTFENQKMLALQGAYTSILTGGGGKTTGAAQYGSALGQNYYNQYLQNQKAQNAQAWAMWAS